MLLEAGTCIAVGDVHSTIARYLSSAASDTGVVKWSECRGPRNSRIRFCKAYLENTRHEITPRVSWSEPFRICLDYEVLEPIRNLCIGVIVQTEGGIEVCGSNDEEGSHGTTTMPGLYTTRCCFPSNILNTGAYLIRLGAHSRDGMSLLLMDDYLTLHEDDQAGHGPNHARLPGIVRPQLTWKKNTTVQRHR